MDTATASGVSERLAPWFSHTPHSQTMQQQPLTTSQERSGWNGGDDYKDEPDSQSEMDDEHDAPQDRPLLAEQGPPEGRPRDDADGRRLNGRRKALKWSEVLWVTGTTLLITVLVYTSQLFIVLPYYRNTPTFSFDQLLVLVVPFNLCALLIFYNYYLCVTTNPGDVPSGWEPDWTALDPFARSDGSGGGMMELKSYTHQPRYCKTCVGFKPPRSHHCKTCGKCVLRMDHHCPWVANCVGHFNYGHFLRFLFFVDVTCTYHLVMLSMRVLDRWNAYTYWREPTTREMLFLVLNYALCIPVLLLVGMFSIYHFYCAALNQTTIESWEKDRVSTMIRRGKIRKVRYPYNVGLLANLRVVLGKSVVGWCLLGSMEGDGLVFDVAEGIEPGAQYRWPPKDPNRNSVPSPALFPATSTTSPWTYGNDDINPHLVPWNSSLRHRGQSSTLAFSTTQDASSYSNTNSESSISSGSDEEDVPLRTTRRDETNILSSWHDDDDNDDVGQQEGRVRIRRGSEGYEVRPTTTRWSVHEPWLDETETTSVQQGVILPSQLWKMTTQRH